MNIPLDVAFILNRLTAEGHHVHIVGGAVRDTVIGRELGDFDITTSARPEEVKRVFADIKTVDTGIKHGTVTVVIGHTPYEVTTYRIDGDYNDNRHPDAVIFTDRLTDDLKRRDFTVNAMAYDAEGGITDPFGGLSDAENRVIRAVGDAEVRFDEDGLRILRALRFASVLDFSIEKSTSDAILKKRELLRGISKERVYTELKKLIMGDGAHRILKEYGDVISVVTEGLEISELPKEKLFLSADYLTRLAAIILYNSDKPIDRAEQIMTALKTDKATHTALVSVLSAYENADISTVRHTVRMLAKYGKQTVRGALALGVLTERYGADELRRFDSLIMGAPAYRISDLKIDGYDVAMLGFRGKAVGDVLTRLLYAVIDGECENTKASLTEYAKNIITV